MKVLKFFLIVFSIIAMVSFFTSGINREPVEKLAIASAIGYDMEEGAQGIDVKSVSMAQYILRQNNENSRVITSKGKTIAETREERQTKLDKRYLLGMERVYIISEKYARHGINDIIDGLFRNSEVRDAAMLCICKDKPENILKTKIDGYPSAGDFIEGLIKYSRELNFFPDNYKLIDTYVRLRAEGRNLVIPYIETKENTIQITGLALFNGEKMAEVLPLHEVKIHNMLRENSVKGVITLERDPHNYLNFYGRSKRKVKCYKEGNSYKFVIDLKVTGDVILNEYEQKLINKPIKKKEIEYLLANNAEREAKLFLEKLKSEYKVDSLELGRVAAAKYGRDSGVDWNEIVSNSDIKVNVEVKIDRFGRGDF